ncbi:hypothetical protein VIOR3934_02707 [Vibrio orientalis CIP 102891 = ATCC 33934]|uniref:DUF4145 domain-containing protein n=1 Tax=Vibrio orientalis CIP 102891 = ATCC 33934 TaxID=675816 RepID=F9SX20_VIBOR|nr:hypothetical protein [Vibrio orientalis]EGU47244.1 hypothetical protein VIOR3934_02707 [Vibrio orientalis CIP 102891 = ATCC 33934]
MELHEVYASLEKDLLNQSEIELVLLKGHLILEQAINQHLLRYIDHEKNLDSLSLMFAKKVDLLNALEGSKPNVWQEYTPYIKRINKIRNKLAHQLNFDDYHDELKSWACDVIGYTPKTLNSHTTYRNTVAKAFCFLVGFLLGVCEARKEAAGI